MKSFRRLSASFVVDLDLPDGKALADQRELSRVYYQDHGRLEREESGHAVGTILQDQLGDKHSCNRRDARSAFPKLHISEDLVVQIDFQVSSSSSNVLHREAAWGRAGAQQKFQLTELQVHFDLKQLPGDGKKRQHAPLMLSDWLDVVLVWNEISAAEVIAASIKRCLLRRDFTVMLSASSVIGLAYLAHKARSVVSSRKALQLQHAAASPDKVPSPSSLTPPSHFKAGRQSLAAPSTRPARPSSAKHDNRGQHEQQAIMSDKDIYLSREGELDGKPPFDRWKQRSSINAQRFEIFDKDSEQGDQQLEALSNGSTSQEEEEAPVNEEISVRPMLILELDMNYKEIMAIKDYFVAKLQNELANCLDLRPEEIIVDRLQLGSIIVFIDMSRALQATSRSLDGIYNELSEQFYDMASELRNGKITSNVKDIKITFEYHHNDHSADDEVMWSEGQVESAIASNYKDIKRSSMSSKVRSPQSSTVPALSTARRNSNSSNITQQWMRYDGCKIKTRNSCGLERYGRLVVEDRAKSLKVWLEDNDQCVRHLREFLDDKDLLHVVQGPACAIRVRRSSEAPSEFVTLKGVVLLSRGKPVGVRTQLEASTYDLTLQGFMDEAVARTGGFVLDFDQRFGSCPCAEWEGVCARCTKDMVSFPANFPERKIRVHVVDMRKGRETWEPLYKYFSKYLLTLQAFCAVNSLVTSAPMYVIKILIGDGSLPPGWSKRSSDDGILYLHDMLDITTSKHPGYVEKTLAEVQSKNKQDDAPSSFSSPTATSPRPARPMTAIPRQVTRRDSPSRPFSAFPANQVDRSQVRRLSSKLAFNFQQDFAWRGDKLRIAERVFKCDRTHAPYSHQAFSSAMLLQSVFRGHLHRLFLLVKFRRLSAMELPVSLAFLAHKMVGHPTTLRMYKRLTVYYVKHSHFMPIPQDFGWPKRIRMRFMRSVMVIQLAVRCHFARNSVRERIREVDYALSRRTSIVESENYSSVHEQHVPWQNNFSQTLNLSPSMSLNAEEKKCLEEGIRQTLSHENLVYLASKENWNINILHSTLENLEKIFFLVSCRIRTKGKESSCYMGAFSSIPWSRYGGYKTDADAFLFSFQTQDPQVPQFVKCPLKRHAAFAILHSCTLQLIDGKFYDSGLIFGRGPDLFLDLRNRTKCLLQLGATFSAPEEVEGSEWLRGLTSFEATELAVFVDRQGQIKLSPGDFTPADEGEEHVRLAINDSEHGPTGPLEERRATSRHFSFSQRLGLNEEQLSTLLEWTGCKRLTVGMTTFLASRDGFESELLKSPRLTLNAPLLVIVRVEDHVFGCFSPKPAVRRRSVGLTNDSFLFRLKPGPITKLSKLHQEHPGVEIVPDQCIACGERGADL
mmetsp:Transcript_1108/g.3457  ORF Transcript_1108/g.3457 Transcript_1108/m.3457 type:complete len:1360 (+) Transcript_1108:175-4254(+)